MQTWPRERESQLNVTETVIKSELSLEWGRLYIVHKRGSEGRQTENYRFPHLSDTPCL